MPKVEATKKVSPHRTSSVVSSRSSSSSRVSTIKAVLSVEENTVTDALDADEATEDDTWLTKKLPLYTYKDEEFMAMTVDGKRISPTRVYIANQDEANDLISCLEGPLGFDMEWRINFVRGAKEFKTAVIQVADKSMVLIIHLSKLKGFPIKLKALIESPDVIKTGVNITGDGQKLFRDWGIQAQMLVELDALARYIDADNPRLKTFKRGRLRLDMAVRIYLGRELDKGDDRKSNWEEALRASQLDYAANDAHCGLAVYKRLLAMAEADEQTVDMASLAVRISGPKAVPQKEDDTTVEATKETGNVDASVGVDDNEDARVEAMIATPSEGSRPKNVRANHYRAYTLWYGGEMDLDVIRAELRTVENPLAKSTVIGYVVDALKASDGQLPYRRDRLVALIQSDGGAWRYHRKWVEAL